MKKIQCMADIQVLEQSHGVPAELIEHLYQDLKVVYEWSVPDQEVTLQMSMIMVISPSWKVQKAQRNWSVNSA